MRLRRLPVLLVFALMMCSGSASALPAVEVDNGMIFGGQSASANNATTATNNLSDLRSHPIIIRYTTSYVCHIKQLSKVFDFFYCLIALDLFFFFQLRKLLILIFLVL